MKKVLSFILTFVFLSCSVPIVTYADGSFDSIDYKALSGTSLTVYNWGEYISDGSEDSFDVISEFEELTGIKVNYETYDSNESMYAKLKSGATNYDIIIPSDYMIQRLVAEDMLEQIDLNNIPNYKYIDDKYKGLFFDPENKYSVPYTAGTVGIIYNTDIVKETPDSWDILWNEDYIGKILMINNPRDAFGIAQFLLGQSVNTQKEEEWYAALQKLKEQKPLIKGYVMDEIFNKMESADAAIAAYYAGDFLTMYMQNPSLAFAYPKQESTNIFVDSVCIPKGAKNKAAAHMFINFLLEREVAIANAEYICYSSPCSNVYTDPEYIEYMTDIHPDAIEILYGHDKIETQYYENLPTKSLALMNSLWEELKVDNTSSCDSVYIASAVIVLSLSSLIVFSAIKKRRYRKSYENL